MSDMLPDLHRSCLLAAPVNLSPQQQVTVQIPDQRQRHGRASTEGCLPALDRALPTRGGAAQRAQFAVL